MTAGLARDYPVLYVDDETPNLIVFAADFEDEFDVLTAASGKEALEILERRQVAVLLTDHRMPGMSGIDLCEQVRRQHPHVLRMMVTAYSDQQTAIDAINRGGVLRYLVKPLDLREVRQVLREAVARSHLEKTVRRFRSAVLDRERVACLAAFRARMLHDLFHVSAAVSGSCTRLEHFATEAEDSLDAGLRRVLQDELGTLRDAVDYFVELHGRTDDAASVSRSKREAHSVAELLDAVAELVRGELAGVALLTISAPGGIRVWADRIDVSRILVNLITRARQALENSELSEGRILVRAEREGGCVLIDVEYDAPRRAGGGEAPGRLPGLRELFSLEDPGDMGLAICHELAVANGGRVSDVSGATGRTVTIRLSLPVPGAERPGTDGARGTR